MNRIYCWIPCNDHDFAPTHRDLAYEKSIRYFQGHASPDPRRLAGGVSKLVFKGIELTGLGEEAPRECGVAGCPAKRPVLRRSAPREPNVRPANFPG